MISSEGKTINVENVSVSAEDIISAYEVLKREMSQPLFG